MKRLEVELTDQLAAEIAALVRQGWFADEDEVVRMALLEFIGRQRLALTEQFQRDDIAWALRRRVAGGTTIVGASR